MINVLLVEDDNDLAYAVSYALKKENCEINVADCLKKAHELIQQDKYSVVLLDIMLPDGTGYSFCEDVRKWSNIPIIFLTSCDEEANIVTGLDMGGDDYITKPFRIRELVSRINAVLRRKVVDNENVGMITSGNIRVLPAECKVFVSDIEVNLTSTEYKLLLTFMRYPNHVLSRNKLLENLWDVEGKFVDNNALSVYVKRLREKIKDKVEKTEYISTLRGIGYKWEKEVKKI